MWCFYYPISAANNTEMIWCKLQGWTKKLPVWVLHITLSNIKNIFLKQKRRKLSAISRSDKTMYYTVYILYCTVYVISISFNFVLVVCGFSFSTACSVLQSKLAVRFFRMKLLFSNSVMKYFQLMLGDIEVQEKGNWLNF